MTRSVMCRGASFGMVGAHVNTVNHPIRPIYLPDRGMIESPVRVLATGYTGGIRACYNFRSPAYFARNSCDLSTGESRDQTKLSDRGLAMSGHSKWATIKHKKGALDAKRGKIFTRLIKEISIAAKNGGGDPDSNPRLRGAIVAAKAENMPADNIKRAIQRGTGELPGATYEEFSLEGYGPGGVAILLDINTDNRNRTVSEIRHCFGKNGGNMADAGAVSWMFHKKGDIIIPKSAAKEDDLMNIVLESGGEDLNDDGDNWEILTETSAYEAVLEAVKKAGIEPASASVAMIPQNYVKVEGAAANTMIRLMEALEEHDDVQNVHSNFDIDQKLLEQVAG